ncbi:MULTISPECIES: glycosyltransferase family 4 protein [Rhodopseudomonas]|uniref:glycosyltransferase family 4 protein n=1 Tax=Rhodopseudomonas TaxID=1073 RepID=UPI000A7F4349|nr:MULTISPECIES: glycosyltransferase family 4 protein [Rhodopseudomonas]MDF3812588.1 glycosyltransferase family 4 protein [Rhodopseudomonas sp. BAL398]WOK17692.1 glycosyltransferase family 4 protein [Rhodopseudomonas sp. BAL398]
MKILYANKYFFRNGGSEVVMFDEIALMKSMGVEVIHFSMSDPRNLPSPTAAYFVSSRDYQSRSIVSSLESAASFVHSPEAVRKISALIRAEQPDLLHCHNIYHQLTPSIISAAANLDIPVVLTFHDLKPVCPVYTQMREGAPCTKCAPSRFENVLLHKCGGHSLPKRLLLWLEARYHQAAGSYQNVSAFVAPSRFLRDAVAARFSTSRIECIPNGIDLSGIEVVPSDQGYVLYFGRITADKGVATLLQAHADDGAKWRLVVAGTGPQLNEYRQRFPMAEFTGFLSGSALGSCIDQAAVVVVPSEMTENCSMAIIEAMAHGKPVVASHIGGNPELVRDGETGFLFPPKHRHSLTERIQLLLGDADLRKRFGAAARKVIEEEYTIAAHGQALLALYTSLVQRRKHPAVAATATQLPVNAEAGSSPL